MPERESPAMPRPFWSGAISFGLVSVPVQLFVANRRSAVRLRMVDADGVPLVRRFVCSVEQQALEADAIERGYEIEKGRFVLVDDDELEALEPKKSQQIDLERFVDLVEIDPIYFDRAYFLVPDRDATRAYRLLASIMQESGRAGIATFVMRGKEYLVAIIAEQHILRAETLRFDDEIRSVADIGLPEIETADGDRIDALQAEMASLETDSLDRSMLTDPYTERLRELVGRKLEEDVDVVSIDDTKAEPSATIVDLMQVLKRSLEAPVSSGKAKGRKGPKTAGRALSDRSKKELYERAQALQIPGRSSMSKGELIEAIRAAS